MISTLIVACAFAPASNPLTSLVSHVGQSSTVVIKLKIDKSDKRPFAVGKVFTLTVHPKQKSFEFADADKKMSVRSDGKSVTQEFSGQRGQKPQTQTVALSAGESPFIYTEDCDPLLRGPQAAGWTVKQASGSQVTIERFTKLGHVPQTIIFRFKGNGELTGYTSTLNPFGGKVKAETVTISSLAFTR